MNNHKIPSIPSSYPPISKKYLRSTANNPPAMVGEGYGSILDFLLDLIRAGICPQLKNNDQVNMP